MLSELKTRFLYASMAEVRRKHRTSTPTPGRVGAAKTVETAETANPIIRDALVDARTATIEDGRLTWKRWPTRRLVVIGIAIAGALLVFGVGRALLWGGDHVRLNRDQLDRVSPYLSYGVRSENGQGPAFVGEIRDRWSALEASDQMLVARDLVEVLRENGVRDVMIYDGDGLLRIQALGEQLPRMLAGSEPER